MDPVQNAATRFAALAALFDSNTERHLQDRGVAPGWHCLEVGGGGGSIAGWLSERVGPAGQIVVTDVDVRFLENAMRPECRRASPRHHSRSTAQQAFDLIHTRMVLMHLPARDQVLPRLRVHSSQEDGSSAKNSTAPLSS